MSWFSKPSEYRRYADGRVEIIERRSLLKISLAMLGALTVAGGTAAVVMTQSPLNGGTTDQLTRHPALTKEIAVRIIRAQDRDAVYRIIPHYEALDVAERLFFWQIVMTFGLEDLKPFGEIAMKDESDDQVRARIEAFLRTR